MKTLLRNTAATALLALSAMSGSAQLANGDIISGDFTITELLHSQESHTLSTYLDAGKTVFIDVSAIWCGPCWTFHETGALEDLYENHGPAGAPDVLGTTTDDVMVFYMEGDDGTAAELAGGGSSQGDWTLGGALTVPLIWGPAASTAASDVVPISAYPTMYKICPDRSVEVFNPYGMSASEIYAKAASCGGVGTNTNDAKILMNFTPTGAANYCGSPMATIKIQNFGSAALTAATIKAYEGTTEVGSTDWTGNLAAYEGAEVEIQLSGNSSDDFTITKFEITTTDDDVSNNTLTENVAMVKASQVGSSIGFDVLTDGYGSEFAFLMQTGNTVSTIYSGFWENWANGGVASMLNYQGTEYGSINSLGNNEQWTYDVEGLSDGCHTLIVMDAYGDGFSGSNGHVTVGATGTTLLNLGSLAFDEKSVVFDVVGTIGVGIEEAEIVENFGLFPNPATSSTNLTFNLNGDHDATINIINALGQTVYTEMLNNVSGEQVVALSTSELESGFYMVSLLVGNDVITTRLSVIK